MRPIVVSVWTTLDGYVAGPNDEMDWIVADDDLQRYETELVTSADALLLGRTTHTDFARAWPAIAVDETADPATRSYAQRVDTMPKFVISGSGSITEWRNTTPVTTLNSDTMERLKRGGNAPLVVYGSLSVVAALGAINMIDEYHLLVHPIAIGTGKALFAPDLTPVRLGLRSAVPFSSGVLWLCYTAIEAEP